MPHQVTCILEDNQVSQKPWDAARSSMLKEIASRERQSSALARRHGTILSAHPSAARLYQAPTGRYFQLAVQSNSRQTSGNLTRLIFRWRSLACTLRWTTHFAVSCYSRCSSFAQTPRTSAIAFAPVRLVSRMQDGTSTGIILDTAPKTTPEPVMGLPEGGLDAAETPRHSPQNV